MENNIVKWFQSFSSVPLDNFFKVISKFGEIIPFAIIFLMFYWFLSKQTAMKYLLVTLVGAGLNSGFKRLFQRPRPYMQNVEIVDKYGSVGYSFPSGHAVFSTLTYGGHYKLLNNHCSKKFNITNFTISLCIILLVMISRVYLGQHYLSDVICGALFGLVWLLAGYELFSYVEKYLNIILAVAIPLVVAFLIFKANPLAQNAIFAKYYIACGLGIGVAIGYLIDIKLIKFNEKLTLKQNILKLLTNLIISAICLIPLLFLNTILAVQFAVCLVVGIILTAGCSIINKFHLTKKENNYENLWYFR